MTRRIAFRVFDVLVVVLIVGAVIIGFINRKLTTPPDAESGDGGGCDNNVFAVSVR